MSMLNSMSHCPPWNNNTKIVRNVTANTTNISASTSLVHSGSQIGFDDNSKRCRRNDPDIHSVCRVSPATADKILAKLTTVVTPSGDCFRNIVTCFEPPGNSSHDEAPLPNNSASDGTAGSTASCTAGRTAGCTAGRTAKHHVRGNMILAADEGVVVLRPSRTALQAVAKQRTFCDDPFLILWVMKKHLPLEHVHTKKRKRSFQKKKQL